MAESGDAPEPFPSLSPVNTALSSSPKSKKRMSGEQSTPRPRSGSTTSSTTRRTRGQSLLSSIVNSSPPLGVWQATGEVLGKVPNLGEIRDGSFADDGWSHEGQLESRGQSPQQIERRKMSRRSSASERIRSSTGPRTPTPAAIPEERTDFFPVQQTLTDVPEGREATTTETMPTDGRPIEKPAELVTEKVASASSSTEAKHERAIGPDETGTYPTGYRFPKKHTFWQSTVIGLNAFWKFFLTIFGFLIIVYALNVVAWGAMIFFILLDAAPKMCYPNHDCNAINSPRKIWIEIDSQVLTALFCVTAFGLAPWRFRDFYYLMQWRLKGNQAAFRRLAGINRSWFRLPGSQELPVDLAPPPVYNKEHPQSPESPPPYTDAEIAELEADPRIPLPATSMPQPPLTGIRAPPTPPHTLDIVIWMYLWNTLLQVMLCGFMWGMNRYNRPSAAVGLLISVGCVVAIVAGIVSFIESSGVKKVEGIPVQEYDVVESVEEFKARVAKEEKKAAKKKKAGAKGKHEAEKHEMTTPGEVDGDGMVGLVRTRSVKVKGRHWYERH